MSTLYIALTILLVFVSISLIALVLLQKGKGADAGAAFGAGASGTVFGARGTTSFLSRTTAILATVFFLNCLALAFLSAQQQAPGSLLDAVADEAPAEAPPAPDEASADDFDLPELDVPEVDAAEPVGDELPELPVSGEDTADEPTD